LTVAVPIARNPERAGFDDKKLMVLLSKPIEQDIEALGPLAEKRGKSGTENLVERHGRIDRSEAEIARIVFGILPVVGFRGSRGLVLELELTRLRDLGGDNCWSFTALD
jgi:hypothetical protein